MKRKIPLVTKLILVALITNSSAVAGTILLSHHLAEAGGNVIGNDTLIPIGVIVVLLALAIKATWAVGKFCDRITKFESRLEKVEQRLSEDGPSKR